MQTALKIKGIPTDYTRMIQRNGRDSNNQQPQFKISDGQGNPCRHCLELIEEGDEMLVFSYKPFNSIQPYAEQGPVFIHRRECSPYNLETGFPEVLAASTDYIVRGYNTVEEIIYGTGKVVPYTEIMNYAAELLALAEVEFVHIRSATNNCYQARVEVG